MQYQNNLSATSVFRLRLILPYSYKAKQENCISCNLAYALRVDQITGATTFFEYLEYCIG